MPSSKNAKVAPKSTVILDNGGGDVKAGLFSETPAATTSPTSDPFVASNALAKPSPKAIQPPLSLAGKSRRPHGHLVAAEILKAPDMSAMTLRRPHDRGFVSSFDTQRDVWSSIFSADRGLDVPSEVRATSSLILTEPLGVPLRARRGTDQLVFEVFDFKSCAVTTSQCLSALSSPGQTAVVVDSGFSFTTAVPVVQGVEVQTAARRLLLGGKALTNLLKQTVSFRSWNMSDETVVMNAVKEACCYVSPINYTKHLLNVRSSRYLLPDPSRFAHPLGKLCPDDHVLDPEEQVLTLTNERVSVPEALFYPADIGIDQAGVAELVVQAVEACDEDVRPDLYANVILTGGNCLFAGFKERFEQELRPLVNSDLDVIVRMDDDPTLTPFHGAVHSATLQQNKHISFITKEHYQDVGTDAILREQYGDDDTPTGR